MTDHERRWSVLPRVPGRSIVHEVQHFLEVFPRFAFGVLIVRAQQVGRVVRDHHLNAATLQPLSAHLGDALRPVSARGGASPIAS